MHRATNVAKCFYLVQPVHGDRGHDKHSQLVFYGYRILRWCWRVGGTTAHHWVPDRNAKFSDHDNVHADV